VRGARRRRAFGVRRAHPPPAPRAPPPPVSVNAKAEADFLALGKQRKIQFIVEELALRADDVAQLGARLGGDDGRGGARSAALSAFWKELEARGERAGRTRLSGAVQREPTDPIPEDEDGAGGAGAGAGGGGGGGAGAGTGAGAGAGAGADDFAGTTAAGEDAAGGGGGEGGGGGDDAALENDVPFTVPGALASGRRDEPMLSSGSYPPSIPPRAGAGGEAARFGAGAGAGALGSPAGGERELVELRAQYNALLHEVLKSSAERNSLAAAAVQRERDFEELREEHRRLEGAAAAAARDSLAAAPGLRRRGGGGGGGGGGDAAGGGAAGGGAAGGVAGDAAAAALDDDDDTTARGADAGFALWQLLGLAVIAFLLGRLSKGL